MKMLWMVSLAASGLASAHDLYLMPESFRVTGPLAVIGVHNGDEFPDSEATPPMRRLSEGMLHTAKGKIPLQNLRADGKRAVAEAPITGSGHMFVTLLSAPSTESMKADEFLEYLDEEGLKHAIDWRASHGDATKSARERYSKYVKTILLAGEGDGGFAKPTGLTIEFIPLADPFLAKVGGKLPVKVLYKGAPAADLQIIASSMANTKAHPIGRTNSEGVLDISLDAAGPWRLHTVLMEQSTNADADWESYWATFTFEIK